MASALLWFLQEHQHRQANIISAGSREGPGTLDFILATTRSDVARCVVCHCTLLYHRLGSAFHACRTNAVCIPCVCVCVCQYLYPSMVLSSITTSLSLVLL